MDETQFWSATDELRTIHRWARARYAAPWSVLGAILVRVAATVEPSVQLKGVIGGRASLNLFVAFASPSGGGKGISEKVARLAWPAEIHEMPIGSGQGIAAIFAPPKGKPDDSPEQITRAILSVPEIDTLAGLTAEATSITLATLKSVAMGEQIGQRNAQAATTRIVPEHSYRCCLSVGAQPLHTGVIFKDTSGGTPQRVLWFLTIDPDMPDDGGDDPDPLNINLPNWTRSTDVVEMVYGDETIEPAIRAAHLARQRGDAEALDGHAMLTRCKVAAVIAIMHHRSVIGTLDWELAGVVMDHSNTTRDWLLAESKRAERDANRKRAVARSEFENVISDRKVERAAKGIVSRLNARSADDGPMRSSEVRRGLRSDLRKEFDAALQYLTQTGAVEVVEVDGVVHVDTLSTPDIPRSEHVDNLSTWTTANTPHDAPNRANAVPGPTHETEGHPVAKPETDMKPTRCRVPDCFLEAARDGLCLEHLDDPDYRYWVSEVAPEDRRDDYRADDYTRWKRSQFGRTGSDREAS